MSELISKKTVLEIIDSVMNNREIDSIRNAILAIRDKVLEHNREQKPLDLVDLAETISAVRLPIRANNVFLPEFGTDGSTLEGARYVVIDMFEKIDTGEYGAVYYENDKGEPTLEFTQEGE